MRECGRGLVLFLRLFFSLIFVVFFCACDDREKRVEVAHIDQIIQIDFSSTQKEDEEGKNSSLQMYTERDTYNQTEKTGRDF